jgi:phosphatidylglycerophosphate synthase
VDDPPDRILTVPNAISVIRLCCVPIFLWLLFGQDDRHAAAWLLAALGARRIDVTWSGKAGTFGQMVAFPLFLVSHADVGWGGGARVAAWVTIVPALLLSYKALLEYVPLARQALAAGRVTSAP